jgi:5,10-methylenetetrahydromethanopterin reductase
MTRPFTSGVVLQGAYEPPVFREMATEIEGLEFDHLWLTDSSLHARNCYAYLTLAAGATRRLTLGTAVTNPITRHPAITAAAAATVDEISHGRFVLGIGAGDRPLLALGSRPSSLASLRSAIGAIRDLWRGDHVSIEDDGFRLVDAHLRFVARADIPVYVSASGPKTLEMAGAIADGVILLVGLFPESLAWAIEHVDRGAAAAERPRPHVAVFAYGAIDENEDRALASARSIAAWFPQTAPGICRLAGLEGVLVEQVRAMYAGGEFQEAADAGMLLPDDFVRKVALAGGPDQGRERIRVVLEAGADSIHVFPLGEERRTTIRSFAACVREVRA